LARRVALRDIAIVGGAAVLLTFVAGVVWSLLYRRWPNVRPLALSHSVLAAVAYPVLLVDAPPSRL
jgi:hypothetical protein